MGELDWAAIDFEPQGERVAYRDVWVERDGPQHVGRFWPGGDERRRYTWLRDLIVEYAPSRRVLDVGCNIGEVLRLLMEDGVVEAAGAFGLDIDPVWVEQARVWCEGATFFHGALEYVAETGLRDLGAVVACEVLEHVGDPARAVEALAEVLAEGGLLLITTPDDTLWAHHYALAHPGKHRRVFGQASLGALVEAAGLTVVDVERLRSREDLIYLMLAARKKTRGQGDEETR